MIKRPSREQVVLYDSICAEVKKRSKHLSDSEIALVTAKFVNDFDFASNPAQRDSAGGWADMILSEIEL